MGRLLRVFGWTMIWLGVFALGYSGYQVGGTNLANRSVQAEARTALAGELEGRIASLPPPSASNLPSDPVLLLEEVGTSGEPLALIQIPSIGLDAVVFEGTTRDILRKGPGHLEGTPMPGQPGNAVLSGHRTTYGAPFFSLDKLVPGDEILVETALGFHRYEMRESLVVRPTDIWVAGHREGAWLTLTTCNPIGSARERLIVFAELVEGPNLDYVSAFG